MKLIARMACLVFVLLLSACGGGGSLEKSNNNLGQTPTDPTANTNYSVSISLQDATSGEPSTQLSQDSSLTIIASVTDGTGSVSGLLVSFEVDNSLLASFNNDTSSALTDGAGDATIGLQVGSLQGAGIVTARVTNPDGTESTQTIGFESAGDAATSQVNTLTLSLELQDATGAQSSQLSAANPLTIVATLSRGGDAIANEVVSFTLDNALLANFSNDTHTALTNEAGIATIVMDVGTLQGAGEVTATVFDENNVQIINTIGFDSAGDGVIKTANVSSVDLIASSLRLPSAGKEVIEVTAIVKDENLVLLPNVNVTFQVDSGELKIENAETDVNGQAKARVTSLVDKPNRVINVQARAATETDALAINVIGTQISINGPESMVQGDTAQLTIELIDSDNGGIAGEVVRIVSQNGNSITNIDGTPLENNTAVTSTTGQINVNYTADSFALDQISVFAYENSDTAGAEVSSASSFINVLSDSFTLAVTGLDGQALTTPCSGADCTQSIFLNTNANLELDWQAFGNDVVGETVKFTTTRGTLNPSTDQVTDASGVITLDVSANNAGPAMITATGSRMENGETVSVTTQLALEFVASQAETIVVQASKASLAPEQEESSIIATVRDPNGNLVKGKTVQFEIVNDTGNGELFPATDVTDRSGVAKSTYTSNGVTALNGVEIKATVQDTPSVTDTVNLTVADKELFIVVGTGNEIIQETSNFRKPFSVFVTDVDSNPVFNKELTVSAVPMHPNKGFAYSKGVWVKRFDGANFKNWEAVSPQLGANPGGYPTYVDTDDGLDRVIVNCYNEDYNIDGILNVDVDDNDINELEANALLADNDGVPQFSEDFNHNGLLTPGNVVSVVGTLTTDEEGKAEFSLVYPQNYAAWSTVNIVVSASVGGTESSTEMSYTLGFTAAFVLDEFSIPPANPLGSSNTCADIN